MINNANYETQKDEVELLKNILFEQFKMIQEHPNFIFEIKIIPDVVEDPRLNLIAKFTMTDEYPNGEPLFEVNDLSNYLASSKIKILTEKIKGLIAENFGMPMIYQLQEAIKEFGNEQEEIFNNENISKITIEEENKKKYEKILEQKDKDLFETKTYTPVSKETFDVWFKKFHADTYKVDKTKVEQELRQNGREYFMNAKNIKIDLDLNENDVKEEETEGTTTSNANAIYFDPEAFEENIDDLDFDNADIDYDDEEEDN